MRSRLIIFLFPKFKSWFGSEQWSGVSLRLLFCCWFLDWHASFSYRYLRGEIRSCSTGKYLDDNWRNTGDSDCQYYFLFHLSSHSPPIYWQARCLRKRFSSSKQVTVRPATQVNLDIFSDVRQYLSFWIWFLSSMTRCSEENELLVCSSSTVALPLTTSSNNV